MTYYPSILFKILSDRCPFSETKRMRCGLRANVSRRPEADLGNVDSGPQAYYAYGPESRIAKSSKVPMPAYLVVQATITDEPQYQKYREAVVPFIASFGGRFCR